MKPIPTITAYKAQDGTLCGTLKEARILNAKIDLNKFLDGYFNKKENEDEYFAFDPNNPSHIADLTLTMLSKRKELIEILKTVE